MSFTDTEGKNPEESKLENGETRVWAPVFLSNDQKTLCLERHEHDGRSGVVHHLTGKIYPQVHDSKQCSPS